MPSLRGHPIHADCEGDPPMARRPGQLVERAHYPSLRLIRGVVPCLPPTFLIGSGHLGRRMAFYLEGQHSSPAGTEPSLALPGASVLVLALANIVMRLGDS